jgi:hypothetical protein
MDEELPHSNPRVRMLIEASAGLLDDDDAATAVRRELLGRSDGQRRR